MSHRATPATGLAFFFFWRENGLCESLRNSLTLFKQLIPRKDIVLSSLHLLFQTTQLDHFPSEVTGMQVC